MLLLACLQLNWSQPSVKDQYQCFFLIDPIDTNYWCNVNICIDKSVDIFTKLDRTGNCFKISQSPSPVSKWNWMLAAQPWPVNYTKTSSCVCQGGPFNQVEKLWEDLEYNVYNYYSYHLSI